MAHIHFVFRYLSIIRTLSMGIVLLVGGSSNELETLPIVLGNPSDYGFMPGADVKLLKTYATLRPYWVMCSKNPYTHQMEQKPDSEKGKCRIKSKVRSLKILKGGWLLNVAKAFVLFRLYDRFNRFARYVRFVEIFFVN